MHFVSFPLTGIVPIGINTSQWFANAALPLQTAGLCGHYRRRAGIFDPSKVQLHFNPAEGTPENLGSACCLHSSGSTPGPLGAPRQLHLTGEAVEPQRTVPVPWFRRADRHGYFMLINGLCCSFLDAIAHTTRGRRRNGGAVIRFGAN